MAKRQSAAALQREALALTRQRNQDQLAILISLSEKMRENIALTGADAIFEENIDTDVDFSEELDLWD